jgi:signal peptidase I
LIGIFAIARFAISLKPIAADESKSSAVTILREYLDAFIVAGLVTLFLITFVIRTFFIPSGSMIPTLQIHDVLLVNEFAYKLRPPADGDIAVFTPPVDSGGNAFIKRVIGAPGDTLSIQDGVVYRNGRALKEPYENEPPTYNLKIANYDISVDNGDGVMRPLDRNSANIPPKSQWQAPNRVPNGFYFMLGDNRRYSDDSHVWGFAQLHGPFAAGPLKPLRVEAGFDGRAMLVLWPANRLQILR